MAQLAAGDRSVRAALKPETNNAISLRAKLRRGVWRNVILAMLLACSNGCVCSNGCHIKPKCENGPGDVANNCLPWPPQRPLVIYGGI